MTITIPVPGVFQVTRFWNFSCHLVADKEGLTLIDTGLPGTAPAILAAAKSAGQAIHRIVLTHAHQDHAGSLDAIAANFPNAEVLATNRSAQLLAGDRSLLPEDGCQKLRGSFVTCKTKVSRTLNDGDRFAGFHFIATPGHAPGHGSYLHAATGSLFTGDAFFSAGGRLAVTSEFRLRFPFPYFATHDAEMALNSTKRLRDLKPKAVLPAHGKAIVNPARDIEIAIAQVEKHAENATHHRTT